MTEQVATNKGRVVVAMSGGVDSSVAAALLVDAGYDVVGMMLRLWSEPGSGPNAPANRCCTPDQIADARRVAAHLDIPFYVIDAKEIFRQSIVQFFIDEHGVGRTPNPCIQCNRQIRFGYLLDRALALGATHLATGHYARVSETRDQFQLWRAVDKSKDQSYVLHVLTQEKLAQALFPVGEYTKDEVRALAKRFGLPVAQKSESMDLCFLGDGDHRRFLRQYAVESATPGPIVNETGDLLGEHQGLPYYTIGQRKGLGISTGDPMYVLYKDLAGNALVVGSRSALGQTEIAVRNVNWVSGAAPAAPVDLSVQIRYRAKALRATVTALPERRAEVTFANSVFGATAGQGAVFYDGDVCLGGGIIADSATIHPGNVKVRGATSA